MAIVPTLPFSGAQLHDALKKLEPTIADRAPLPSDDETQGYTNGSRWQFDGMEWLRTEAGWLSKDEAITPEMFGAVGNGVTDDTAALQSFLNSEFLVLTLRAATYLVSGQGLSCPDHKTLRGAGKGRSILKLAPGLGNYFPILHERVVGGVLQPIRGFRAEGVTFLGNGSAAEKVPATSALFRCYASEGNTFIDCEFRNGRGYGVGLQGQPTAANPDRRGPHLNDSFIRCDFIENGLQDYITTTDTMDGLDVKHSEGLYVEGCTFIRNGDKGLDIRGVGARAVNCYAEANTVDFSLAAFDGQRGAGVLESCQSVGSRIAGFQVYGTPAVLSEYDLINCSSDLGQRGLIVPSGVPGVIDGNIILRLKGCSFRRSATDGLQINAAVEGLSATVCDFEDNAGRGVFFGAQMAGKLIAFTDCYFNRNLGGGFIGPKAVSSDMSFLACRFDKNSVVGLSAGDTVTSIGTTFTGTQGSNHIDVAGVNSKFVNTGINPLPITAAAAIALPPGTDSFVVNGTTNITSIAPSYNGREVVLRFRDVLTVTDGGNLYLAGSLTTANRTILRLMSDGANWYEISRSVN